MAAVAPRPARLAFTARFYSRMGRPTREALQRELAGDVVAKTRDQHWCAACGEPILPGEPSWADRNGGCYRICMACVERCEVPA